VLVATPVMSGDDNDLEGEFQRLKALVTSEVSALRRLERQLDGFDSSDSTEIEKEPQTLDSSSRTQLSAFQKQRTRKRHRAKEKRKAVGFSLAEHNDRLNEFVSSVSEEVLEVDNTLTRHQVKQVWHMRHGQKRKPKAHMHADCIDRLR
jgi:predicted  nucleic acid-binding Zn-ribbon protein